MKLDSIMIRHLLPIFLILLFCVCTSAAAESYQLELKDGKSVDFRVLRRIGEDKLQVILNNGRKVLYTRSELSEKEVEKRFAPIHIYGKAIRVKSKLPNDFSIKKFKQKLAPLIDQLQREEYKVESLKLIKLAGKQKISKVAACWLSACIPVLPYFVYKPNKKSLVENTKVPLVIFLHGVGETGDNVKKLFRHPQVLAFISPEHQEKYPCFFLHHS